MADAPPSFDVGKQMLSKVLSLLANEVSLAWGCTDELKRLGKSLEMVRALLKDAAENKSQLTAVQRWVNNLNAVAYDADAVLDDFTYETLRQKVKNRKRDKLRDLFSRSKNPVKFRLTMAHKIKSINESLDEVYKEGTKIELVCLIGAIDNTIEQHSKIRLTHPYIDDDSEVVGRDDDVSKIIDMLLCPDHKGKNLLVIAIVGMAGQGKTTLAQLVCKHGKVKAHFDERIWVVVSQEFDELRLLNEMVQSLTGENPQLSNVEGIIENKLGKKLKGKRYLLVLDDVWSHDPRKWETMRNALLEIGGSSGSRIMVTTRSEEVVSHMQTSLTRQLGRLSEEDSWTMFKHRAFAKGGAAETQNLLDIGREMVNRCGGLPLAIKALGGLMYSKKFESEWSSIQSSRLWEDNMGGVLPTLKLSYDHLPTSLKQCFAFCSIFPKDLNLEKSKLIQLWMALGLLHPSTSNDLMEDIGSIYFNTLLWNSLLQDAKKDEYNSITTCKMHDVVHELALYTAKNYCSTLHASQTMNDASDIMHLSLTSSLQEILEILKKISPRLQTLILNADLDGKLLANLKCLRVLVLERDEIVELPDSVGELKHLRYLDISSTSIVSLPNTITKLYNLQTLRLGRVLEVPENFGRLINLRHICIDQISKSLNCMLIGIGQLTCLQTLPFFVVNKDRGCLMNELGSLNNLRGDLNILGLEDVENFEEAMQANLSKKLHLRTLKLIWGLHRGIIRGSEVCNDEDVLEGLKPHSNLRGLIIEKFAGGKFPSWMMAERLSSVLLNLVKIKVYDCRNLLAFPEMHCLTSLRELVIRGCEKLTSVPQLCTSLQSLRISLCYRLTSLPKLGTTLEKLDISNCPAMVLFPDFRYLQKLVLFGISEELDYFPWPSSSSSTSTTYDVAVEDNDGIQCLKHVELKGWSKIKSLPEQLQHLSAMTYLSLDSLDGLESLPEWLGNLSSLQSLYISSCDKLMYMPPVEAMRRLINLSRLQICGCPLLRERCIEGSRPEWEKISHITTIKIDEEVINENGTFGRRGHETRG